MFNNIKSGIRALFHSIMSFDEAYDEFELLETEATEFGEPSKNRVGKAHDKKAEAKTVSTDVHENKRNLQADFRCEVNTDILMREFLLGGEINALAVCMNGMANTSQVNDFILRQGMKAGCMDGANGSLAEYTASRVFAQQEVEFSCDWAKIKSAIIEGRTVVFIDGDKTAILMDTRGFESRGVPTAENEKVIRGPHEAFNESLRTNVTLLRRIIKTEDFICEFKDAGAGNNVKLVIAYRAQLVNPNLLNEVKRRLNKINTRMLLNNGTIEQLTERRSLSPLPQSLYTERPDRTAAHIMQGHVAVLLEGCPAASIMPATFFTLMSTSEDAYMRRPLGIIARGVRYIGAALSIMLPGYFLAISLHHPSMLSTEAVITIISSRQTVFLPMGAEMLFLLWIFQLLREAGIRVPGSVGQSLGIIGGLILGQAAVAANMVSTVVLIIVALAGLGNFTIPDYSTQVSASYFRVLFTFLGWIGGLLGISMGILAVAAWMVSIKSYGVPFFSPVVPKTYSDRPGVLRGKVTSDERPPDFMNTQEEIH